MRAISYFCCCFAKQLWPGMTIRCSSIILLLGQRTSSLTIRETRYRNSHTDQRYLASLLFVGPCSPPRLRISCVEQFNRSRGTFCLLTFSLPFTNCAANYTAISAHLDGIPETAEAQHKYVRVPTFGMQ